MDPVKRTENIDASLVRPICIGRKAIIVHNGKLLHTAAVIKLHESTYEHIRFETEDAHYCISFANYPIVSAAVQLPLYAAA